MAANDTNIRVTVSMPKARYERLRAVTQANGSKKNTFINASIEEKLAIEEKVLRFRRSLQA